MALQRVTVADFDAEGKAIRFKGQDSFGLDASERTMTPEGFMVVPGKISRTGIQEYSAHELGIEGTDRTIRLLRHPKQVFAPDAVRSFEGKTLTSGHPDGNVSADNWKMVTSGDCSNVRPVGDGVHVGAMLTFKDANAIRSAIAGKDQLSCGYTFGLDMTPGVYDGEAYDGMQCDIRGNHVAHVYAARGGPGLRIADNDPNQETDMATVTTTIDSLKVTFADEQSASIVERALKAANDSVAMATAGRKTAEDRATAADATMTAKDAAHKTALEAKDKEIADLKLKVVGDDKLDGLVDERLKVIGDAQAILGDKFDGKGKTNAQIVVAALDHVIANDADAKVVAQAILKGAEPAKADAVVARYAFDAVTAGAAGRAKGRASVGDADIGRALFVKQPDNAGGTSVTAADAAKIPEPVSLTEKMGKPATTEKRN